MDKIIVRAICFRDKIDEKSISSRDKIVKFDEFFFLFNFKFINISHRQ